MKMNEIIRITVCAALSGMLFILVSCGNKGGQPVSDTEEYKVMEISLAEKSLTTTYSASIKGKQDVEIRPQVSGLITEIHVSEGQRVRKGQTLFTIDQVAYRAALETAKANVEASKAEVKTARLTAESK